jgi:hypothetical protein
VHHKLREQGNEWVQIQVISGILRNAAIEFYQNQVDNKEHSGKSYSY